MILMFTLEGVGDLALVLVSSTFAAMKNLRYNFVVTAKSYLKF